MRSARPGGSSGRMTTTNQDAYRGNVHGARPSSAMHPQAVPPYGK